MPLKLKEPYTIQATYRIVTPMFIGDAEQKASGISPTSVKGALRFWWRALRWGQIRTKISSDTEALKQLHQEEGDLFGTAADNGKAARFTLHVTSNVKRAELATPQPGIQYFLGQGLYHFNRGYLRTAIGENSTFDVCLLLDAKAEKQTEAEYAAQKEQLTQALLAFGLLGGLGSRARKGFGSVAIEALTKGGNTVVIPKNTAELTSILTAWNTPVELPPFTAFSTETRIDVALQGNVPLNVLNAVGQQQQLYRSYGRANYAGEHIVAGEPAEQNFLEDHDLVLGIINQKSSNKIPKRSVFGLPHNYFFSAAQRTVDFAPITKERTRRAAPLLIHVHQFPNQQVAVLQSLFPATFLPDGDMLEFKVSRGTNKKLPFDEQTMVDWQVIHNYMDRFSERVNIL